MSTREKHFTENDRIFYSDGYQLAQSAIRNGLSRESLFEAIETLYTAIDSLNNALIAYSERQNIKVACAKGCHWCCHQAVFANSYELHFLSDTIRERSSSLELKQIFERAKNKHTLTSELSEKEVLNFKSPCPLLSDGACSFYSARPMACRIYLSTRVESCLDFFHSPENEDNYPQLLEFPLRAGRLMNEGFRAALKESGVETAEFKLEEGLKIALKNMLSDF